VNRYVPPLYKIDGVSGVLWPMGLASLIPIAAIIHIRRAIRERAGMRLALCALGISFIWWLMVGVFFAAWIGLAQH
jgi:hypothetical protein